jgi:hypothetical protein
VGFTIDMSGKKLLDFPGFNICEGQVEEALPRSVPDTSGSLKQ